MAMPRAAARSNRVRIDNRPGIVFRSVDAVGVAGECRDPRGAVQSAAASARRNSLLRPPRPWPRTVTVVSPPERSTAGGDTIPAPTRKCPARDLQRDPAWTESNLARLALDPVAQDDRGDPAGERGLGGGGERLLRAGDQFEAGAGEDRVAGLRGFLLRGREMGDDGARRLDAVFGEHRARIGKGGRDRGRSGPRR